MFATTGAKIAMSSIRAMITRPPSAKRSCRKCRQKISQGLRPMIDAGVSADGAAASRSGRSRASPCSTPDTSVSVSDRLMPGKRYYGGYGSRANRQRRERHRRSFFEGQGSESGSPVTDDQGESLRVQARATHQRPVDLRMCHELPDVAGFDAAAVLDADRLSDLGGDVVREGGSDDLHDLSRVRRFGVAPRADRPDRLVGDHGARG